ncbi:MAG: hypothetical protein GWN79_27760, partial [Actinobacteria bacterium]|nr:hypothetical protein [Actinomycetota bacterium]NIS36874.1 hypothetical protein [Actinomycetota bacterium]NIT98960.1 hypothetical protein [Actinomycetota bacterium]NIU22605.1 hypothetical protein [Actinomycetota bacterium]NIU71363.1 hypothetical protein [Actinomycetota bacterium]
MSAEPVTATVEPGADAAIAVSVNDATGAPVPGADVLVVVADEAVLALSGYQLIDPVDVFYRTAFTEVGLEVDRGRRSILLADPQELLDAIRELEGTIVSTTTFLGDGAGGDDADGGFAADLAAPEGRSVDLAQGGDGAGEIEVRQNFDALAVFDPEVTTGADGTATVEFRLPDNLTRYRVMAIAVDGTDRFGSSESNLTARLPLQVRPSAPRFLNFGDDFELPIVLQNLTDEAMDVDVVLQTSNLEIAGSAGRRVAVPANDRIEVRFPVRTESAGTARFRAAAVSADHADAATVALPVYTPATTEAFATYGTVDDGAVLQTLAAPTGVFPQFGGLEVTTSSTAVQALTDAVFYLTEYPYRCADAYASRIIAITALRPVLDAFGIEDMPTPAEFEATLADDIKELSALQNWDGGFGWWFRDQRSRPFQSIQAMHALVVAAKEGSSVSQEVMENGRWYLRNIREHIPADWTQETKDMLEAYALHVRNLDGEADAGAARALWNRGGADLGLDALAWIWPIVADAGIEAEIERTFRNRATETAAAATFATDYGEDAHLILHSDR